MKQLADGVFEVPSDSDYNRTYIVNLTHDVPQCTCTAWAIQRNRAVGRGATPPACKHIRQVQGSAANAKQRAELERKRAELEAAQAAKQAETKAKQAKQMSKMAADLKAILDD